MKIAYFAILALLFVSASADDAKKLGAKCPFSSKYVRERIEAKEFEKICLNGKVNAKSCDGCAAYLTSKLGPDFINEVDMPSVLAFYANSKYTYEQKSKAMFEACSFKLTKAAKALGVKTGKVNTVFKYPNGNAWKCSWNLQDYPKTIQLFTEYIQDFAGPLLGAINLG